jgi:Inward rectifier potassium channel C-terminal domain
LALPWIINHTINEESPLFRVPPSEWGRPENHFELIVVMDAIDEGASMNVQARYSYLPHEIASTRYYYYIYFIIFDQSAYS